MFNERGISLQVGNTMSYQKALILPTESSNSQSYDDSSSYSYDSSQYYDDWFQNNHNDSNIDDFFGNAELPVFTFEPLIAVTIVLKLGVIKVISYYLVD